MVQGQVMKTIFVFDDDCYDSLRVLIVKLLQALFHSLLAKQPTLSLGQVCVKLCVFRA